MKPRLDKKLEELRRYYSDEQIAEDFSKYADQYAKDGFDKNEILKFSEAVRQDPGVLGAAWQGLTREVDKLGSGGAQLGIQGRKLIGNMKGDQTMVDTSNMALESLRQEESVKNANLDKTRQQHPYAVAAGETIPALLPSGRAGLGAIASPAATYGLVGGLQYGSPEERASRATLNVSSGMAGGAVGEMAARAIKPTQTAMSSEQRRAMGAMRTQAQDAGTEFKPPLSDLTQSPTIKGLEDTLSQTPFVQDVVAGQAKGRQSAINKVAAKSIGQNADNLGVDVITEANRTVDDAYKNLRAVKQKAFQVGPSMDAVADSVIKNEGMKRATASPELIRYAQDFKKMVALRYSMTGEAADIMRQEIAKFARDTTGNESVQWARLRDAFDDSVRNSARQNGFGDIAESLDKARNTLRNLKTVDRPAIVKGGDVQPGSLRPVVKRDGNKDPGLNAIGDYNGAFPPVPTGSRTFGRAMVPWLASQPYVGGLAVGGGMLASKAMESDAIRQYLIKGLLFDPELSGALATGANPMLRGLGINGAQNVLGPVFGEQ